MTRSLPAVHVTHIRAQMCVSVSVMDRKQLDLEQNSGELLRVQLSPL